mmetsp:Transcript_4024/g.25282  ORF Transcript_4024/g.25282 Transcript_4024/m.25282 type:complete len:172 (-) Transcript_4024:41-556(-)
MDGTANCGHGPPNHMILNLVSLRWRTTGRVLLERHGGHRTHRKSEHAIKRNPHRRRPRNRMQKECKLKRGYRKNTRSGARNQRTCQTQQRIMWPTVPWSGSGRTSTCSRWSWQHREEPWKQSGVSVLRTRVVRQGVSQRARKCEPGRNARLAPTTNLHLLVLERLHALVQG